jgi:aryl-alcohol dehydrogenase-like predicted oxidoreductase
LSIALRTIGRNIRVAVEESLRRLRTDWIDLPAAQPDRH